MKKINENFKSKNLNFEEIKLKNINYNYLSKKRFLFDK